MTALELLEPPTPGAKMTLRLVSCISHIFSFHCLLDFFFFHLQLNKADKHSRDQKFILEASNNLFHLDAALSAVYLGKKMNYQMVKHDKPWKTPRNIWGKGQSVLRMQYLLLLRRKKVNLLGLWTPSLLMRVLSPRDAEYHSNLILLNRGE